jgi:N-acetylneuraminate synthase
MRNLKIGNKKIGLKHPTYFIADIGANHDGSIIRAKKLIKLAKLAGADAAKFQHFTAKTIVSDKGFKKIKSETSHQKKWKRSVFEVYKSASINSNWTKVLKTYFPS